MFIWFFVSAVLFAIGYCIVIWGYLIYWKKLEHVVIPNGYMPSTFLSVVIPARNEALYLPACIQSILENDYPNDLYEIIIVDDHSDDGTADSVISHKNSQVQVFKLEDFNLEGKKKAAIDFGIRQSKGHWIVTTDADCVVPQLWLKSFAWTIESTDAVFIAAPVNFFEGRKILEKFQALDFMGMMIITGAGISGKFMNMCNGANLAYSKAVYQEVDGFTGIDHLASGDDMLLMQKIAAQYGSKIRFIKSPLATVLSYPQPDMLSLWNQRIRWASKSSAYPEKLVTAILAIVFLFCVFILSSLILSLFFGYPFFLLFLGLIIIKAFFDFLLLNKASRFFGKPHLLKDFLPAFIIHTLYILIIGTASNFKRSYLWKDRIVK